MCTSTTAQPILVSPDKKHRQMFNLAFTTYITQPAPCNDQPGYGKGYGEG